MNKPEKKVVYVDELGPVGSGDARNFLFGGEGRSTRIILLIGLVVLAGIGISQFVK